MTLVNPPRIAEPGPDGRRLLDRPLATCSMEQLRRRLAALEIERDSLRAALVDAGFSLKVAPIERYAAQVGRYGAHRVSGTAARGPCARVERRTHRSTVPAPSVIRIGG